MASRRVRFVMSGCGRSGVTKHTHAGYNRLEPRDVGVGAPAKRFYVCGFAVLPYVLQIGQIGRHIRNALTPCFTMSDVTNQHSNSERQSPYLLWTRMQAEAGQGLDLILQRKERERIAGGGRFFWGVGNAPAVITKSLARMQTFVPVIFSKMKSRPKSIDENPSSTVIWRQYIDHEGRVRPLPANALVTSRGESHLLAKRSHYALECFSAEPIRKRSAAKSFDPSAYRNASGTGRPVGASQVTSLLVPAVERSQIKESTYSIDFQAVLAGSYWVKLVDPLPLEPAALSLIDRAAAEQEDWVRFVAELRGEEKGRDVNDDERLLL